MFPPVLDIGMVKGVAFREPRGIFSTTLRDISSVRWVVGYGCWMGNDVNKVVVDGVLLVHEQKVRLLLLSSSYTSVVAHARQVK